MRRWKNRPAGSNWGEFGDDDQRGKMNLLTPERRRAAAREVLEGIAFCLSLPLDYPGGSRLFPTRQPPRLFAIQRNGAANFNLPYRTVTGVHEHTDVTCDDAVTLYTQYSTQWDALLHMGSLFDADGDGKPEKVYYNGFRGDEDIAAPAAGDDRPRVRALGIDKLAEAGVQGRGTLVDLHAVHGRKRVAVGYDELMAIMSEQRAEVLPGDFLCLYTGLADLVLEMKGDPDPEALHHSCPGLDANDARLLEWISASGLVAICADNTGVEVRAKGGKRPPEGPRAFLPLHEHCLFKQGIHLGELWYFTELARWLAGHDRRHFLLTAPPLRLPGSAGSPLTPIATV
jgi:hypothetical protein